MLVYTLTQAIEKQRYAATAWFFNRIGAGSIAAATSFYALHELYLFALDNAPDFSTGAAFGKGALTKVLSLPLQIFPFVPRTERRFMSIAHDEVDGLPVNPRLRPEARHRRRRQRRRQRVELRGEVQ